MYDRAAAAYDVLHAARQKDYAGEAARIAELVRARHPGAQSLLDTACGTGGHLRFLRDHFDSVEGVDGSPAMLSRAREKVPGVVLHEGDLRTFDLGRRFDAVTCLFSSIAYLVPAVELERGIANLSRHLVDGGVLVVEPWIKPEDWDPGPWPRIDSGQGEGLSVTRMTRSWRVDDRTYLDMQYLIGTDDGIEHVTEDHETGLYDADVYRAAFTAAGCSVEVDPEGHNGRGLSVGVKG